MNYYAYYTISKDQVNDIVNLAADMSADFQRNDCSIPDVWETYEEQFDILIPKKIHLGKKEDNRQFIWDGPSIINLVQPKELEVNINIEDIKEALKNVVILNEYNHRLALEEFISEIKDSLYTKEDINELCIEKFYYTNGLKFSTFTNFG